MTSAGFCLVAFSPETEEIRVLYINLVFWPFHLKSHIDGSVYVWISLFSLTGPLPFGVLVKIISPSKVITLYESNDVEDVSPSCLSLPLTWARVSGCEGQGSSVWSWTSSLGQRLWGSWPEFRATPFSCICPTHLWWSCPGTHMAGHVVHDCGLWEGAALLTHHLAQLQLTVQAPL